MSHSTDAEVLAELEASGEQWQFRSRVGSHQYLRLYDLVRRHLEPGAHVLDWGAANGHFSYFLVRSGFRATGYSLFDDAIPEAVSATGYRLVVGDPSDPVTLPFEDGAFDAVSSIGVLEHVRETGGDERASLREIVRVLRPGGAFICFHLPNRSSWIDGLLRLAGAQHHAYRYTSRDVLALVQASGMELVETRRYALLPRNPMHHLPLAQSERFAQVYDAADGLLGSLLPWICTNHYFVARTAGPDQDP